MSDWKCIDKENSKYHVFITPTRESGLCSAIILSKEAGRAEYFDLPFYQHGTIRQTTFVLDNPAIWQEIYEETYKRIDYNEFLALLCDALYQCYKYNKEKFYSGSYKSNHLRNAINFSFNHHEMMYCFTHLHSERQLINCYLNAVQNCDSSLIYELYSSALKEQVGGRDFFMTYWYHELQGHSIIKSEVIVDAAFYVAKLLVMNDNKELLNVEIYMEIIKERGRLCLDKVVVMDAVKAFDKMPDLINNAMHVITYSVKHKDKIENFLAQQDDIIISGEYEAGICYKWLQIVDFINDGVGLLKQYRSQMILNDQQLILYHDNLKELNLVNLEIRKHLSNALAEGSRGCSTIGQIYRTAIIEGKNLVLAEPPAKRKADIIAVDDFRFQRTVKMN